MKTSHFFAMLSRMKYINRWGLMNNTTKENISEHSLQTAMIAHALVLIHNRRFGGDLNAERAMLLAVYHDTSEIITGDMPTPVKYFNPSIVSAYKAVEKTAQQKLLSMLPDDLQDDYRSVIIYDEKDKQLWKFVKAADKLSALIKCIEEIKMGNSEFTSAKKSIENAINNLNMPEAQVFMQEFIPSFSLTLDEQS
ncbi:MAG: 5'-deoxynucleotidase [Acutalibacteraceae bacterium]